MKILFIGDIVGEVGRRGIKAALPILVENHQPDLIIANVENLAHGKGVTAKTMDEVKAIGVQVMTGGNHSFAKDVAGEKFEAETYRYVTPANDPRTAEGGGYTVVKAAGQEVLVINLRGQLFFDDEMIHSPFGDFNAILESFGKKLPKVIFVDFHAEATSEKVAFGFFTAGRASAVVGTHTHIPTADERVLEGGTAYVTDVGMCGPVESVLGVKKEIILNRFLENGKMVFDYPEHGTIRVGVMLVEVGKDGRAQSIRRVDEFVEV